VKPIPTSSNSSVVVSGCFLWQWIILALFCLFVQENEAFACSLVSVSTWQASLSLLGGTLRKTPDGWLAIGSLQGIGLWALGFCGGINALAAAMTIKKARARGTSASKGNANDLSFRDAFVLKTRANAFRVWPLALWALGWLVSLLIPAPGLINLLIFSTKLALSATLAGWLWEIVRECWASTSSRPEKFTTAEWTSQWRLVLAGMAVYTVTFVAMNWGLWFNLQLPHGDSSMYEEHLWNVLHGKGFRSYLDQGLFLGEHIQVIHLLLLPLYALWPSHLFMELSESAALAVGALPVLFLARRHGHSEFAAVLLAFAYLLYFPMQSLDIAIDLKTFRPSAFGIPALLFMIDMAERRRWGGMSLCVVLALACQEDFAIAIAPYGIWLLAEGYWHWRREKVSEWRHQMIAGGILAILGPVYVIAAVKFAIPWFRSGVTVHYASYFQAFGKTPVEIVLNILTNPALLWTHLVTAGSFVLLLDLLLPLGMPLRAWRRLLVGLPLLVLLCLNELTKAFPGPFHHFHAPLIPFLLWGAAAGLSPRSATPDADRRVVDQRGLWIFCCALTTTFFFSLSPLGLQFWDAGGPFYWKRLYVPNERAQEFSKVLAVIPRTARVASTDFVHPRFTHYERSYDYSHYPRRVADDKDKVPDDTDYIVIDTTHRYSDIQHYEQTREYRNQRDQWEELPLDTKGYFIVLKRVKYPSAKKAPASS